MMAMVAPKEGEGSTLALLSQGRETPKIPGVQRVGTKGGSCTSRWLFREGMQRSLSPRDQRVLETLTVCFGNTDIPVTLLLPPRLFCSLAACCTFFPKEYVP